MNLKTPIFLLVAIFLATAAFNVRASISVVPEADDALQTLCYSLNAETKDDEEKKKEEEEEEEPDCE